jgi:DNA-directed RNA polymerase specialized sigma24 family protein
VLSPPRFYLDLTVAQTAHALDCSEGTVKALTHKAVGKLRRHPALAELKEVADVT